MDVINLSENNGVIVEGNPPEPEQVIDASKQEQGKSEDNIIWEQLKQMNEKSAETLSSSGSVKFTNTYEENEWLREENSRLRSEFAKLTVEQEIFNNKAEQLEKQIHDLQNIKNGIYAQWHELYNLKSIIKNITTAYIDRAIVDIMYLMADVLCDEDEDVASVINDISVNFKDKISDISSKGTDCAELLMDYIKFTTEDEE